MCGIGAYLHANQAVGEPVVELAARHILLRYNGTVPISADEMEGGTEVDADR